METIITQLVNDYMAKKEELIKDAITSKIGTKWTFKEVEDRGAVINTKYDDEVFIFDGKPLIKFKKPVLKTETVGTVTSFTIPLDVSYLILDEEFNVVH
jgi:hypothetical protein